jgi:repressor of nif and glnA expression
MSTFVNMVNHASSITMTVALKENEIEEIMSLFEDAEYVCSNDRTIFSGKLTKNIGDVDKLLRTYGYKIRSMSIRNNDIVYNI